MISQRLHTLKEAVNSMRTLELESVVTQKSCEMTFRPTTSLEDKGKGKRPFISLG